MTLITEHRESRTNKSRIVLHEFKIRYKKNSNTIYGFVEGNDDPCFYRGFIDNNIPDDWNVELWGVGGKDKVLEVYSGFDWRSFQKSQILFFIDRDLSEFTKESIPNEMNIFVTEKYSIENDIVNQNTCERILREVCGFSDLEYESTDKIKMQFDQQLECFQRSLIPVMSNIIIWRKNNKKVCLNDIYMKHAFRITNGILSVISRPKNKANIVQYIHHQCNLEITNEDLAAEIAKHFENSEHYKKFTRGKYLLWFLIEFCLSIYRNYNTLTFVKLKKKPRMVTTLSLSNAIILIGPRCKIPKTLKTFFENTIDKYVALKNAA